MGSIKEKKMQEFNASTVAIKGTNIIEASAGTGKTYSIAILVLRFVIEKNIPLKKILMVTFTKAAVAELEVRIRVFIREAFAVAQGEKSADKTIEQLVKTNSKKLGIETVKRNLATAINQFDQTSIYTIHSFCQKTLNEFAFETKQLFDCDVIESEDDLIQDGVNTYWRQNITILPKDQLHHLLDWGLNRSDMKSVAQNVLAGKVFVYDKVLPSNIAEVVQLKIDAVEAAKQQYNNAFKTSEERSIENINSTKNAFKKFGAAQDDPDMFLKILLASKSTGYVQKLFPTLLELAIKVEETKNNAKSIIYTMYGNAATFITDFVKEKKKQLAIFSYNDLIQQLHTAATTGSSKAALATLLENKYDGVFIDEFQDTDKLQYEIFDVLFSKKTIKFYIGDPKQSIYAFRGADLNTYKTAVENADFCYTMDTNYRSSVELIEAYNDFYTAVPGAFLDDKINYEEVKSIGKKPFSYCEEAVEKPLEVIKCKNKEVIQTEVIQRVKNLLFTGEYKIGSQYVQAQDIGILVRSNISAKAYKEKLASCGIPAITIDDTNVLQSKEAELVCYLLEAILTPSISNLNRVLLSVFTNRTPEDVLSLKKDWDINQFKEFALTWQDKGIYATCKLFLNAYNINTHLNENIESPERILSNLLQIFELLHKRQVQSKCTAQELFVWLQQAYAGNASTTGDVYTQRLETDENAVQIVTIHKSKGLAYPIVLAPELDLKVKPIKSKNTICSYKNNTTNIDYFTYTPTEEELGLYTTQNQQENERLIYVALTRSVHATYIFKSMDTHKKDSSITPYVTAAESNPRVKIIAGDGQIEKSDALKSTKVVPVANNLVRYQGDEIKNNWSKISFSALSQAHQYTPYQESKLKEYDHFVFDLLPRGAECGNLIHYIFENINFHDAKLNDKQHHAIIKKASETFTTYHVTDNDEIDFPNYLNFIYQVLYSKIFFKEAQFSLAELDDTKKVPELEFSFDLKNTNIEAFAHKAGVTEFNNYGTIEGMLTGFVDLFFEHDGKYYILDWKSNYIGHRIEDYSAANIAKSMKANNYHFQYLLYTIALKRYLTQNIPNFNYERDFGGCIYVYVRGCRKDTSTGIYTAKPSLSFIQELEASIS